MSIVQYNPWGNARGLQDEIKQVFDRFLGEADADHADLLGRHAKGCEAGRCEEEGEAGEKHASDDLADPLSLGPAAADDRRDVQVGRRSELDGELVVIGHKVALIEHRRAVGIIHQLDRHKALLRPVVALIDELNG